ncbi:MAG TPA: hypothetical protein VH062_37170 [Polyangiaceae bacterium]|nr:hypothetical protein [Polyangiaceae bacterium]
MFKKTILGGFGCVVVTAGFVACSGRDDGASLNAGLGAGTSGGGSSGYSSATLGAGGVTGPHYLGAGTSFSGAPLQPGVGADSANECSTPPSLPAGTTTHVVKASTACVYGDTADPAVPAATVEEITEVIDDKQVIHVRITFDPHFVDNSYGQNAVGWGTTTSATTTGMAAPMGGMAAPMGGMAAPKGGMAAPKGMAGMMGGPGHGGHTFDDLVGSDHVEVKFTDASGALKLHVAVDYISQDPSSPCGYGTLGVTGGEGKVFVGSASDVIAVATSLDRDLNGCGYCLTTDSPATDDAYTPNMTYPKWDYRVVYEMWIDAATFGGAGFGDAVLDFVHASPSKLGMGHDTVDVTPKPCPPDWNLPYCTPDLAGEGLSCGGGTGGGSGSGGATGSGGASSGGADGGNGCPAGWIPDLETEGRTCTKVPQ